MKILHIVPLMFEFLKKLQNVNAKTLLACSVLESVSLLLSVSCSAMYFYCLKA